MIGRRQRLQLDVLAVAAAAAIATAVTIWLPGAQAVGAVFGVPFVLGGQGYVLTRALFTAGSVSVSTRVTLSLALSIALIIVIAIALNVVGVGITPRSLALGELGVTLAAAWYVNVRQPTLSRPTPGVAHSTLVWWALSFAAAVAVFAVSLFALARPLPNSRVAGYTQLWAVRGVAGTVSVGVKSAEHSSSRYRVLVQPISGSQSSYAINLRPGESWMRRLRLTGPPRQIVEIKLYRATASSSEMLYRTVSLRP